MRSGACPLPSSLALAPHLPPPQRRSGGRQAHHRAEPAVQQARGRAGRRGGGPWPQGACARQGRARGLPPPVGSGAGAALHPPTRAQGMPTREQAPPSAARAALHPAPCIIPLPRICVHRLPACAAHEPVLQAAALQPRSACVICQHAAVTAGCRREKPGEPDGYHDHREEVSRKGLLLLALALARSQATIACAAASAALAAPTRTHEPCVTPIICSRSTLAPASRPTSRPPPSSAAAGISPTGPQSEGGSGRRPQAMGAAPAGGARSGSTGWWERLAAAVLQLCRSGSRPTLVYTTFLLAQVAQLHISIT